MNNEASITESNKKPQVSDRMKLDISSLKKMRRERGNMDPGVKDSIESATVSSCGNNTPPAKND